MSTIGCHDRDTSKKYVNYLGIVNKEAAGLGCAFYPEECDGRSAASDGFEAGDLYGWLVPVGLAREFEGDLWRVRADAAAAGLMGRWGIFECAVTWLRGPDEGLRARFCSYDYPSAEDAGERDLAVERFKDLHGGLFCAEGHDGSGHALRWVVPQDGAGEVELRCACGATLHLGDQIWVEVAAPEDASGYDAAADALFQSAYVTLSSEELGEVRHCPSSVEMHLGLGMSLRDRFVRSGLVSCDLCMPDMLSDAACEMLVRRCVPEFEGFPLVYDRLQAGTLLEAFQYCLDVRGALPLEEFTRHYGLLEEAETLSEEQARVKEAAYERATLEEVWDFARIRALAGEGPAEEMGRLCLDAAGKWPGCFLPSELAMLLADEACDDERALDCLEWAAGSPRRAGMIPRAMLELQGLEGDAD